MVEAIVAKKPKKFRKIVKDSYNTLYGIDHGGTFRRLDKLDFHNIPYTVSRRWR